MSEFQGKLRPADSRASIRVCDICKGLCIPGADERTIAKATAGLRLLTPAVKKSVDKARAVLNPPHVAPPKVRRFEEVPDSDEGRNSPYSADMSAFNPTSHVPPLAQESFESVVSSSSDAAVADSNELLSVPMYLMMPMLAIVSLPLFAWSVWGFLEKHSTAQDIQASYEDLHALVRSPAYIAIATFAWVLFFVSPVTTAVAQAQVRDVAEEVECADEGEEDECKVATKIAEAVPVNIESAKDNVPGNIRKKLNSEASRFKKLASSLDGWKFNFEKKGIKCYTRPGSKMAASRGTGVIPFPPRQVLTFLMECARGDDPRTFELDPDLKSMQCLQRFDEQHWIDYLVAKSIGPVGSRDFLNISHWRQLEGGRLLFFGVFHKDDAMMPRQRGCTRGEASGAWLLSPLKDGSETVLTKVVFIDLKGWIPGFVIRQVVASQGMQISKVRAMMLREASEKKEKSE